MTTEEISPERQAKAKRTKWTLIIVIVLLLAALGGLVFLGYKLLLEPGTPAATTLTPSPNIVNPTVEDNKALNAPQITTAVIPGLTSLFGCTIEEVQAYLGSVFQLVKTEASEEPDNPDVKQLATINYNPRTSASTSTGATDHALAVENIYASLDAQGKVIALYYVCSMDLLGYPTSSFETLVASQGTMQGILMAAGVSPADFNYIAPTASQYTQYDNPDAANRIIKKESFTFSGTSATAGAPSTWKLTLTYDYGTGTSDVAGRQPLERMIYLNLR